MYIKRKAGGQKQAGPRRCSLVVVVDPPCHWLMVVPFVVLLDGGGGGGLGPLSPLVDGGGARAGM